VKVVQKRITVDLQLKFNQVLLEILNDPLREAGIRKKKRQEVCSSFMFGYGSFYDSMWIKTGKKQYKAALSFLTRTGQTGGAFELLLPDESELPWHEVAHFEVDAFFKNGEKAEVETVELWGESE